jgi:hypothetical protein
MPKTVRFFRDTLTLDERLIDSIAAAPGDTVVIAARELTLSAFAPLFHYVLAADRLTVAPGARTSLIGPSLAVTVLAQTIAGQLFITSAGFDGSAGEPGQPGEPGDEIEQPIPGRPPLRGPGGAGGDGGEGGDGDKGGNIVIRYASASGLPAGSAPGGAGGRGGPGGAGGAGRPRGARGRSGRPGKKGASGQIDVAQVPVEEVWMLLDSDSAAEWAAYRAEVAGFFFRKFDPDSQITAFEECRMALFISPSDANALTIRDRIVNRQTPSGLARDLDIAPDYRALSQNLFAEIAIVQNAFQAYVSVVTLETIAESIRDSLTLMATQLANRRLEAQANVVLAQQDVRIAEAETSNIDFQIADVQAQIDAIRNEGFSIGGLITDVATVAGFVAGMATGAGAIISIAGGLATLQRVGEGTDLMQLFKFMRERPDPNSRTSEDIQEIKALGGDFKDLIQGTKSFISFAKLFADMDSALAQPGQDAKGRLLKQQLLLTRQRMVGKLRETQARSRVGAAQLRVANLESELVQVQERLAHWAADAAALAQATDLLIRSARLVVDMVMEDVFLAQRAREIYQLDRIAGLRFDFGHLHPDVDRSLTPATRASSSLTSLSGMAIQLLAWDKIFQHLNSAQIGFDVIHPQLSLSITDPAKLAEFAGGAALEFGVSLADVPDKMFELKVNAMSLEMLGATSPRSTNIWITHSGQWSANRRTDGSVTDLLLLPRSELFACSPGVGTLRAKIPANPQSNPEPGPPFSFWGRGVATTFRLQVARPSVVDLSQLTAINVLLDCIGYAVQGGGASDVERRELTLEVRSSRSAAAALGSAAGEQAG